ncbi:MAG: SpoIID/LytB domain-containing protein [Paludibacteraceae bacterium]|nr:SpoIID/LytB domain-containing protein [Paludibacteraceae bacterium]
MKAQYPLSVGIMAAETIRFTLNGAFTFQGKTYTGEQEAQVHLGHVQFQGDLYPSVEFTPMEDSANFTLRDVIIGVGFHWERPEDQTFLGALRLIVENTTINGRPSTTQLLTAINMIGIEDYLTSVISSEMSATSSMELLKAHAVTSRSWVICPIMRKEKNTQPIHGSITPYRRIVWYERDAHTHFDVCADDHCQRYQGITRISAAAENVRKAIEATWGQVIRDEKDEVCDARFYKCCGGATELFENAWADEYYHYLEYVEDAATPGGQSFCDTKDPRILSQVLNNYDQETADFYHWTVRYSAEEVTQLVRERSGLHFGRILDLVPIRRGVSDRIVELQIRGTNPGNENEIKSVIVGKELEIRRILSTSHLYSSAFEVEKVYGTAEPQKASDNKQDTNSMQRQNTDSKQGTTTVEDCSKNAEQRDMPEAFILHGKGWGHGVGLCQIGAAVMADQGYPYQQILSHYFPGSTLSQL